MDQREKSVVEMGEAYPRYAELVFVSNMNVLDRHLEVIDDLGDQRGYEALGLFGVLCSTRKRMRS